MAAPAIVADVTMTIIDANPAATTVFGYTHEELVGQNVKVLMNKDVADQHEAYVDRYTNTGEPHIVNQTTGRRVQGRHKNGSTLVLVLTLSGMVMSISATNAISKHDRIIHSALIIFQSILLTGSESSQLYFRMSQSKNIKGSWRSYPRGAPSTFLTQWRLLPSFLTRI